MRTIAVVTVGRSDYGIYLPLLKQIQSDLELRLQLLVSGMHLSPEFGLTVEAITADGFEISERIEMLLSSDTPVGIAKSIGLGVLGFAQAYACARPDILVVLGDRFEMYAAALAALPFKIPVAHVHGGELTEGALDDALRHSMTKLSHLHFVSTMDYARRVVQLGEEPWRVIVSGALSLDHLTLTRPLTQAELEGQFGLQLEPPPLLVTFHPTTLEYEQSEWQLRELLAALEIVHHPLVFTSPNADTGGRSFKQIIKEFILQRAWVQWVDNLGAPGYFGLMTLALAMVGNSSSGIIEAASFKLPVVNIGQRQRGRLRGANVLDVGYTREEIVTGIRQVLQPEFRARLHDLVNPYGDGHASERITHSLRKVQLDEALLIKHFYDWPSSAGDPSWEILMNN